MTTARHITAVDIGGTHVRFAPAELRAGERPRLGEPVVLRTAEFAGLTSAWQSYLRQDLARVEEHSAEAVSVCFAGPVRGQTLKATNSHWLIQRDRVAEELGVKQVHLMNDFGAMAYGVSQLSGDELEPICGPTDGPALDPLADGVTTVIGPGTGLGVAILIRRQGRVMVLETEGGHVDFAPLDEMESAIVKQLREQFLRVSVERIVSGPGLNHLAHAIARIERRTIQPLDDPELWAQALDPDAEDDLPALALQRFCRAYGAVAGDLALAHGASRVVLVGGLSNRLAETLRQAPFFRQFCAKGRYQADMAKIPVLVASHDQLGLLGAAAGFAAEADLAESSSS
ncbi:MAG: glucokinase [Pseudomonadota bacterium]